MIQIRRIGSLSTIAFLCLLLAACGIGGDDDEDPTPTVPSDAVSIENQPTATSDETATPDEPFVLVTPTSEDDESTPEPSGPGATIVSNEGTPDTGTPSTDTTGTDVTEGAEDEDDASPAVTSVVSTPSPTATTASATELPRSDTEDATPVGDSHASQMPTPTPFAGTGSDGTSGPGAVSDSDATPEGPADDIATPAASGNAIEVDACDVVELPPYAGSDTEFVTVDDVNFRVGPGSDCASVLDGPLGPNVALQVVGGPVVRTDDPDGILWVQVIVGEETGWVALDFIESASAN